MNTTTIISIVLVVVLLLVIAFLFGVVLTSRRMKPPQEKLGPETEVKDTELEQLPTIPDHPEAPLPAWKHYGITNYGDQKIQEELSRIQYSGFMVGLEMAYKPQNEKTYAMAFGRIDIPTEESQQLDPAQESEEKFPLSDDFLESLYEDVDKLITANTPGYSGKISPELTISITGSRTVVKIACRRPQVCSQGHSDTRWCQSVNNGPWTCLSSHRRCP